MLSYLRTIHAINAHIGAELLRILVSRLPQVHGASILTKPMRALSLTASSLARRPAAARPRSGSSTPSAAKSAAQRMGANPWVLEDSDPFQTGFFLR